MAYVSMLVVGLSAGQIAWAVLPETKAMGWMSVVFLGVLGAVLGGLGIGLLLNDGRATPSYFHPVGSAGSVAGTLMLVGLCHLVRHRVG